jgi:hypothetical protein
VRFRILGPIRVDLDGRGVTLTASRDARNQLQGCVSRLWKRLSDGGFTGQLIVTETTGYRAAVDREDLDLLVFRRLVAQARTAAGPRQLPSDVAGLTGRAMR